MRSSKEIGQTRDIGQSPLDELACRHRISLTAVQCIKHVLLSREIVHVYIIMSFPDSYSNFKIS